MYELFKVARYSFIECIPPTFERKLRRHKQRLGKINTTVVLDKDETLLWSGLQWHRSCHGNEMTPLPILLAAAFLGTGNCSSKIVYRSFFLQKPPRCSWSLSEIYKSVFEIFWGDVFMVRNTVKKWTILIVGCYLYWTKRFWQAISPHSSFNFFKNVCERSWRYLQPIARKKDLISMHRGALISGNVNFRSTLTN